MVQFNPIESIFRSNVFVQNGAATANATLLRRDPYAPTSEQREAEREARRERMRQRNARIKDAMQYIRPDTVERVSDEEMELLAQDHPSLRKLGWSGFGGSDNAIQYADPGEDYDMWQQAYRMLGGYIDCDHKKSEDSHDGGNNNNDGDNDKACSRWMLWASVSIHSVRSRCDDIVNPFRP